MARRREHLSAYLCICVSGRQQNHKKIEKIQERIIRYRLKKNVPAGSNAYLRICYFLKKSQPKHPQPPPKIHPQARGVIAHPFEASALSARPHVGR